MRYNLNFKTLRGTTGAVVPGTKCVILYQNGDEAPIYDVPEGGEDIGSTVYSDSTGTVSVFLETKNYYKLEVYDSNDNVVDVWENIDAFVHNDIEGLATEEYVDTSTKKAENAILWDTPDQVQINTTAKTITFNNSRISAGNRSRLSGTYSLSYDGLSGLQFIVFPDGSGEPRFVSSPDISNPDLVTASDMVVGRLDSNNGLLLGVPGGYSVDGVHRLPIIVAGYKHGTFNSVSPGVGVDINTSTQIITFNGELTVDGQRYQMSNVQYNYAGVASQSGLRYLLYNTSTGTIGITLASSLPGLQDNRVVICSFRPSTLELRGLPAGYRIDSMHVGGNTRNYCAPLSRTYDLNFNFIEDKIELTSPMSVVYRGWRYLVPAQTVDIAEFPMGVWVNLTYDPSTEQIVPILTSQIFSDMSLYLGGFIKTTKEVQGFDNYCINGIPHDAAKADYNSPLAVGFGWVLPNDFTAPTMPGYTSSDPFPLDNITSATINGWYDDLVTAHPDYVTRTFLGNDASNALPIYEYRFKAPHVRIGNDDSGYSHSLRIMLNCLHSEQINYVYPYEFMRLICEEWESNPFLEALRWGAEISVIPALNPYAIDNKQRPNFNDVDINRNFPDRWFFSADNPGFGSGPTPLSEPETQYCYNLMKTFKPHIFIDCHSWGAPAESELFWLVSSSQKVRSTAASTVNRLARKWQVENSWMPNANELAYVTGHDGSTGGTAQVTGHATGALSLTLEIAWRLANEDPSTKGSPLTIRYAVEGLGNQLLSLIKLVTS